MAKPTQNNSNNTTSTSTSDSDSETASQTRDVYVSIGDSDPEDLGDIADENDIVVDESQVDFNEAEKAEKRQAERTRQTIKNDQKEADRAEQAEKNIREQVGRPSQFPQAAQAAVRKRRQADPRQGAAPNPVKAVNQLRQGNIRKAVKTGAGDFLDPTTTVSNQLNSLGELTLTGSDIIRQSEEVGEEVERNLPQELEPLGSTVGGGIAAAELTGRGQIGEAAETFLVPGNQNELEKKRTTEVQRGIIAGPGTLAGFAVGGTGAVGKSVEQEIEKATGREILEGYDGPGIGGSVTGGGQRIVDRFQENPGGFTAQEIGEEIGEGIATLGVGTAAITPSIEPNIDSTIDVKVPDSVVTSKRFVEGDLGFIEEQPTAQMNLDETKFVTRVQERKSDLPEIADEQSNSLLTKQVRNQIQEIPEESRVQIVEGFDEEFNPTGGGVKISRPFTRREFLSQILRDQKRNAVNTLPDLQSRRGQLTLGRGTRIRLPKSETEPSTQTESTIENFFNEFSQEPEARAEAEISVGVPSQIARQTPNLESRQRQKPVSDFQPENFFNEITGETEEVEQVPQEENRFEQNIRLTTLTETEFLQQSIIQETGQIENFIEPEITSDTTPTTRIDIEGGENNNLDTDSFFQVERSFQRTPSLDAVFKGITVEENQLEETDNDFTGLETRPIILEEDGNEDDLFSL